MSTPPPGTQSINRTLDVIECFLDEPSRGINEIARVVDLSPSTTHRLVQALVARGYLEQDPRSERYHLGRSAALLSQVVQRHLGLDRVHALLEQLGEQTGESVNMGLLDGDRVIVTLRVSSPHPLRFEQPVGTRLAPHCSSMGKALLAFSAPNGPESLDELAFEPVTPNTISSKSAFLAELETVRQLGYSTDDEESIIGVSCVGAPILNAQGRAKAAIAVQAPTARMSGERSLELAELIVKVAAEISDIYPG